MKILEEIGLTKREAEIYEKLLQMGESPVSALIQATGSHPQVVYRVIDSLNNKGLAIKTRRRNRTYVQAESPKQLEKIEEIRLQRLRKALPDLTSLQASGETTIVRTAKGEDAVRALRTHSYDELKSKEAIYIIGGSGDRFYKVMGERFAELERKRIRKRIHRKLIAFENQRVHLRKDPFVEFTDIRYLSEEYPVDSSTNIFGNMVAIIIWASDPIVITIESHEVAQSYKRYFSALWRIAQP